MFNDTIVRRKSKARQPVSVDNTRRCDFDNGILDATKDHKCILNVSTSQLLDLWDELHSAMHGDNGYGGDVVEFYFYKVMPSNPWVWNNPNSEHADEDYYSAACNLHAICRLFEQKHNVAVTFEDGSNIDNLLDKSNLNRHRTHLQVTHRAAEVQG